MAKKATAKTPSAPAPVKTAAVTPAPATPKPKAASKAPAAASTPLVAESKPKVTHDMLAKRAYEIWESKGRPVGRDVENWQQAERELGLRK